jgi:hypothetical protein
MWNPRALRWAIRAFAGLALGALLLVVVLDRGKDEDTTAKVVRTYLEARRAGDAEVACDRLSSGERRELVARVSRTPVSIASGRDCERYVLRPSAWSDLTRPALATFRVTDVEVKSFAPDVRLARPSGFRRPVVEVWKRGEEWKLDTQAAEGSTFVRFCARDAVERDYCKCLFDQTRAADPRVLDRAAGVMDLFRDFESGRRKGLLEAVRRRCEGKRATRPPA